MSQSRVGISPGAAVLFPLLYFLDNGGWFAAVIPSILMHELAHALAIRLCGGKIHGIYADIGGLRLEAKLPYDAHKEALCAIAGPMGGLIWCAVYYLGGDFFHRSAQTAAALNIMNLLPAWPLDGGRALYALSGNKKMRTALNSLLGVLLVVLSLKEKSILLLYPAGYILVNAVIP